MSQAPLPAFPAEYSAQFFGPPHPEWTYGTKVDATPDGKAWADGEKEGWTVIDATTEDTKSVLVDIGGCSRIAVFIVWPCFIGNWCVQLIPWKAVNRLTYNLHSIS